MLIAEARSLSNRRLISTASALLPLARPDDHNEDCTSIFALNTLSDRPTVKRPHDRTTTLDILFVRFEEERDLCIHLIHNSINRLQN